MSHRQYFAIIQNGGNHYAASRIAGVTPHAAAAIASETSLLYRESLAQSRVPTLVPAVDTPVKRSREDDQAARVQCQRRAAEMSLNQPAVDTPVKRPRKDAQSARVQRQRRAAELSVNQCDERSNQGGEGMQAGRVVRLIGLVGAAHLNGQVGKLVSFDRSALRWHVQLSGNDVKAIKLENLQLESEASGNTVPTTDQSCSQAHLEHVMTEEQRQDYRRRLQVEPWCFESFPASAKGDIEIIKHAIDVFPGNIAFVSEALCNKHLALVCNDKAWMLRAMAQRSEAGKHLGKTLKNRVDFFVAAVRDLGAGCAWNLQYASQELRADREAVLAIVRWSGFSLKDASAALRNDRLVVLAAVTSDAMSFSFASKELRNDLEIAFEAVKGSYKNLEYAGPAPRGDCKIVRLAVMQSCESFKFASESLRNDRELILQIVERGPSYLKYASPKLRDDCGVVLAAVKQRGSSLQYASKRLKADRDLVLKAMEQDRANLKYASKELQGTLVQH